MLVRGHTRDGAGPPRTNLGACQFERRADVVGGHSMQVVKEQALRLRSGTEAAPAAETKQKARFLADTGPQKSVEGRRQPGPSPDVWVS